MSALGIIPDPGYGGLVVTVLPPPAGVTNAYVPPDSFTVSTPLTFYGANCSANRFDPQQLNAFESEMLCLAATINPNGTWNAGSVCNLGNAFSVWAASISGDGVSLAKAADYPGSHTSDSVATTPAYVGAAITAAFSSPLAVIKAASYPSTNDAEGATPAYVSAAILAGLATSAAYPGSAGSNILSTTPAYVTAAIAAATSSIESTVEALIPAKTAAASYPSSNDNSYATPAYVAAAVAALSVPGRTNAAAYPSSSDTTYSTPAYVGAAIAALSIPSRTNAAAYPSSSDTTYATPAYVAAAVAAVSGGSSTYAALTDVDVSSLQNNQIPAWNNGASKWENIDAPYNAAVFAGGTLDASEVFFGHAFPYAVEIPSGATNSQAVAGIAATGTTTVTIKKNGSSIGTIAWSTSGTVGVFTFASSVSFAAGDIISLTGQSSPDATLANISITLAGFRL